MPGEDVKYDALLRPVHDNLLRNWDLSLCLYLDDFMSHLQEEANMNFSEAAMILQNSTTFYCKRVDVVHKMIQEFVMEVCTTRDTDKEEGGTGVRNGVKRKKQTKSLEMDDLQLLDFVTSDHCLDGKIEKLTSGVLKQIVLSSVMKALRKSGASITVYQGAGIILGQKEEFRVFGKTCSDGSVHTDINFDENATLTFVHDESMNAGHDDFPQEDGIEIDEGCEALRDPQPGEMLVENLLGASISHKEISTQLPEMSTLDRHDPELPTVRERCAFQRPRKNGDWEPVPFEHKVRLKPVKVGSVLNVPLPLLESEDTKKKLAETKTNKRKRGGARKVVEEGIEEDVRFTWIDQAIRVGATDAITFKISLEKSKRDRIPTNSSEPTDIFVEPDEAMGPIDDDEPGDFEAFLDDHDLMTAAPVDRLDPMVRDDGGSDYADEAIRAIEQFKENRRNNASRATEVAKRVAAWHESLMPVLEDAEARSRFDVHEYGTRILSEFPDDDFETFRPFKDVVVGQPLNEICRYFLSSLMLANTYNLEIRKSDPAFLSKDCVELRLISKVRHHEEMDEAFRVTSADS